MSSSNSRGDSHAPGVKCIVAVTLTPAEKAEIANILAKMGAAFDFTATNISHIEQADNGKIVTITQRVTSSWSCKGCGGRLIMMDLDYPKMWEVSSEQPLWSPSSLCNNKFGMFEQQHLIPIGRDDLLKGEPKRVDDTIKPKAPYFNH